MIKERRREGWFADRLRHVEETVWAEWFDGRPPGLCVSTPERPQAAISPGLLEKYMNWLEIHWCLGEVASPDTLLPHE